MGLGEWFQTFCGNLQIRAVESISLRYKAITQRLNTDFWITTSDTSHSLYVGSYGRTTAIEGFSDLDMVFELPYSVYEQYNSHLGNGQSALLQAVRTSLRRTYSSSEIGADGQVITICFTDDINFEIVPVFVNTNKSYTYPDANGGGSWKVTNPRPEIKAIRDRNTDCSNNLVPLCRMMRAWKSQMDLPMGGLLIDTLAYQFIETWPHRDKSFYFYDWMCRDFFDYMANQPENQTFWRAPGSGQYVHKKGLFQWKARRGCNLAKEAIAHESATPKREWSAKQKWREIFGTAFPDL